MNRTYSDQNLRFQGIDPPFYIPSPYALILPLLGILAQLPGVSYQQSPRPKMILSNAPIVSMSALLLTEPPSIVKDFPLPVWP